MIFHIALQADWEAAGDVYRISTRGRTLAETGFIHCCDSDDQVRGVAGAVYADETAPLVLLTIDESLLTAPVERENLDGGTELFPHIYGALNRDAVVAVTPMRRETS